MNSDTRVQGNNPVLQEEKIPCSIAMLTLNSDEHLEQCLESARRFDVFILDGNSTDRTLEIARQFNVPVFKQVETEEKNVRIKDFTAMRMRGREMARHDWIFDLDSDEYISPALVEEVAAQLQIHKDDLTVGFDIQNKHIIQGKIVEHSFVHTTGLRLYNKKSGVSFEKGKLVHEKYAIPPHLKIITLKNCIYSYIADSYEDCIKKDAYYLSLVWTKSLEKFERGEIHYLLVFRSIIINFLRAFKILAKSVLLYGRYGFKNSLPFSQVIRHARYHILVSGLGIKTLYYYLFISRKAK